MIKKEEKFVIKRKSVENYVGRPKDCQLLELQISMYASAIALLCFGDTVYIISNEITSISFSGNTL